MCLGLHRLHSALACGVSKHAQDGSVNTCLQLLYACKNINSWERLIITGTAAGVEEGNLTFPPLAGVVRKTILRFVSSWSKWDLQRMDM